MFVCLYVCVCVCVLLQQVQLQLQLQSPVVRDLSHDCQYTGMYSHAHTCMHDITRKHLLL